MKNLSRFMLATAVVASLSATQAKAAGFYIQEQSVRVMGAGFAGASAVADDASVLYYNPAGMARLDGPQATAGISALKAWADNHNEGSTLGGAPIAGTDSDDPIPFTRLPHAYAAYPFLENRAWVGLGFSAPFGLSTHYDSTWYGRYDSIKSELTVLDIQPTVAVRATDWLSIGGGVNVQRATAELTNAVTNGVTQGLASLKGDDWATGYNLGAFVTPVEGTDIGFTYRSKVNHTLEGHVVVTGVTGLNEDTPGRADLNLPDIWGLSIAQKVAPQWTLLGQVNRFNWSRFKDITATRDTNGTVAEAIAEDYKDTWSFAMGAAHDWNDRTTVRFGYQYDQTPTSDTFRDTRVPDGDRHNFTAGVSYDICPNLTLDASALYARMTDEDSAVSRNAGQAQVRTSRDDTSYMFGGIGVTYKF